ncbi:cAMP-activated global transcriptional regulator CRP [Roseovarius litorisediminis]|uniref:cAMP-activated global transcriptional regulator CRP n=1 Tax=Roseovarius litorisediminis TaxID=1312363 RepID=A0A1Y5TR60_9RHOB|nr:cyclic nucleotide-binding domain-containing protein [Roseovarius litorisediminis]SLN69605.1 cAMP-activated global transcriptional regulator CRP [Roseovarius litorisediminis]
MSAFTDAKSASPQLKQAAIGVVIGFDNLGHAVAIAALVFAGEMIAGATIGMVIFLMAAILGTLSLNTRRSFAAPMFSNVQNVPIAVLIPVIFLIHTMDLNDSEKILNVLLLLGLTAILTGIAMIAISAFDLGRMIRLIPFAVTTGYLAASGTLLIRSSFYVVCEGQSCSLLTVFSNAGSTGLVPLLTILFAMLLWCATRVSKHFGTVSWVALSIALFYLILFVLDIDPAEARNAGLLPDNMSVARDVLDFTASFSALKFDIILENWPIVAAAILLGIFGAMLNVTGAEIAVGRDVDTRQETFRAGAVNLVTGCFGSSVSYVSPGNTTIASMIGAKGRYAPFAACVVMGGGALFANEIYTSVPRFVSAGLLMFLGISIVNKWLLSEWRRQRFSDWLLSFAIVAVALTLKMPTAIVLGIVTASLIFAVNYGRLSVIRSSATLGRVRSAVDRGPLQTEFLDQHGHEIAVVSLQGFLFFGSVMQLSAHIRNLFKQSPPVNTVVLDFRGVSRIDGAAIVALHKLELLASERSAQVILCELNPHVLQEIERRSVLEGSRTFKVYDTCDIALETLEDDLLRRLPLAASEETAKSALIEITGDQDIAERFLTIMDRELVPEGTLLLKEGEKSGDVFIIDQGSLSVYIKDRDGKSIRVLKQKPGAIVGEIASYSGKGRTANVVADSETVVYRFAENRIRDVQETEPVLAAIWHKGMASALAKKLQRTNQILGDQTL